MEISSVNNIVFKLKKMNSRKRITAALVIGIGLVLGLFLKNVKLGLVIGLILGLFNGSILSKK